eukprot:138604-Amphidinium_carterae.1
MALASAESQVEDTDQHGCAKSNGQGKRNLYATAALERVSLPAAGFLGPFTCRSLARGIVARLLILR